MPTRLLAAVCGGLLAISAPLCRASPAAQTGRHEVRAPAGVAYAPPITPLHVVRGFVAPVSKYGAGHRGADLATDHGGTVRAAGAGVVRFAGRVAGRGVVVIVHPDGVSTEYEPLSPSVAAGTRVAREEVIGTLSGRHGACAPDRCLHWGARRDGAYFDPLLLLRPLGPVRLLPWSAA